MSLEQWAASGWLKPYSTSKSELRDLLAAVDRDRKDARKGLSADWTFNIAYNAARTLCTMAVEELHHKILAWLRLHHPELLP